MRTLILDDEEPIVHMLSKVCEKEGHKVFPFTQSVESWQTTMSEPDAANPSAETGIWNVKSGASGTGTDGRPYSEW